MISQHSYKRSVVFYLKTKKILAHEEYLQMLDSFEYFEDKIIVYIKICNCLSF